MVLVDRKLFSQVLVHRWHFILKNWNMSSPLTSANQSLHEGSRTHHIPSTLLLLSSGCHFCLCVSLFQNKIYWHCRASPLYCWTLFAILSSLSQFASVVILIWSISFGDGSRWESSSIELHVVTQNNGQNGTPLHIYFHLQFIFLLI